MKCSQTGAKENVLDAIVKRKKPETLRRERGKTRSRV
jgi:hypothetical protein